MPNILYSKLSFSSEIHTYATRHAVGGYFTLPKTKTAAQRTVIYRAMKEWNSLPDFVIQQKNMISFKNKLKDYYLARNSDL